MKDWMLSSFLKLLQSITNSYQFISTSLLTSPIPLTFHFHHHSSDPHYFIAGRSVPVLFPSGLSYPSLPHSPPQNTTLITYPYSHSTAFSRASLVAQWLRICLPMQGTRVRALVREDPTCRGATRPVSHNYWACTLEPTSHSYWSPRAYSLCSATREATTVRSPRTAMKSSPRSPQLEKSLRATTKTQRSQKKINK